MQIASAELNETNYEEIEVATVKTESGTKPGAVE